MAILPEMIITDILSRLPVKSVVRFMSVSKPFHRLISDPYFAKMYLKHSSDPDEGAVLYGSSVRGKRSLENLKYLKEHEDWYNPLFELFSVTINELTGNHLYGKIELGYGTDLPNILLFNQKRPLSSLESKLDDESEGIVFVNKDGVKELLLNGPRINTIVFQRCEVTLELTLMNESGNPYETLIKWCDYVWIMGRRNRLFFDAPLSATFKDEAFGSVTLNYAVFWHGVAAKVEVALLQDNTTDIHNTHPYADHVLGHVYAKNSFYENKTVIFNKKIKTKKRAADKSAMGIPDAGKLIPLSKSILALPHKSQLTIAVDLTDASAGLLIVKDVAVYPSPHRLGSTTEQILGGKVRVSVRWGNFIQGAR